MLCYIMKIIVIFLNTLKFSKKLSYRDVFQVKKTIQGVSVKED